MRALVLESYGQLRLVDRDDPEPGPGEALIRVAATGICGSDLHGYTGDNGRRFPGQIMGHEASGTLLAAGTDRRGGPAAGTPVTFNPVLACGQCPECQAGSGHHCRQRRVIGVDADIQSSFADLLVVPAGNVVPLPAGLPVELGALIEPLAVAYHAARRGGVQAGDDVLILGGGPIGQSAVLAAQSLGAGRILVSEPVPGRRALCAALGATVIDPAADAAGVAGQVSEVFGGPASVALDAVGLTASVRSGLAATRMGGTVVLVGMGSPEIGLGAFDISTKERSLVGSFTYTAAEFAEMAAWTGGRAGLLRRLVTKVVPAEQADAAFAELAGPNQVAGKVLVSFARGA
jgi:threonine dehydrogenase-like Zn-dependent dehydrogenase